MSIGEKIRSLRKERKITQKKLALLSGIAEITIRQYEAGKYAPKLEQLKKIAKALDVPITELISPEGIELRKENAGLEALKAILECVYDNVDFVWNKTIDREGIEEHDGDYDVFMKKGKEEIHLTKQSYETLFDFVCKNIPVFIDMIDKQNNK